METWYYEYDVIVMEDYQEEVRRGVVCAESFGAVTTILDDFYGADIIRINKIACISECLYEFNNPEAEFKIHVEA